MDAPGLSPYRPPSPPIRRISCRGGRIRPPRDLSKARGACSRMRYTKASDTQDLKTHPTRALPELLRGKGAHADPIACIEDINADLATQRISGYPHSIADLVFHMNYWMNYELKRIRGEEPKYPEHNAESFPSNVQDWDHLKRDFAWFLS